MLMLVAKLRELSNTLLKKVRRIIAKINVTYLL